MNPTSAPLSSPSLTLNIVPTVLTQLLHKTYNQSHKSTNASRESHDMPFLIVGQAKSQLFHR